MKEVYPVGTWILLKRVMPKGTKIILANDTKKDDQRAEYHVMRVGEKVTEVKPGDIMGCSPSLMAMKFRGEDFFLADEKSMFAVIRENQKSKDHIEGLTVNLIEGT